MSENSDAPEFIIFLCMDVLLEVLGYGDRRRLIKLELIGRRYHRMIENFFKEAPFIRISLRFEPFRLVFLAVAYFTRPSFGSFFIMSIFLTHSLIIYIRKNFFAVALRLRPLAPKIFSKKCGLLTTFFIFSQNIFIIYLQFFTKF